MNDRTPFGETRFATPFETSLREMTAKRKKGNVPTIAEQLADSSTGEVFPLGDPRNRRPRTVYEAGRDLGKRFAALEPEPRTPVRSTGPLDPRTFGDLTSLTREEVNAWAADKSPDVVMAVANVYAAQMAMKEQRRRALELIPEWSQNPERMAAEIPAIKDYARECGISDHEINSFDAYGSAETLAIWRDRWLRNREAKALEKAQLRGRRHGNVDEIGEYLAVSKLKDLDRVEYAAPEQDADFEARLAELRKYKRSDSKDAIAAAGDLFATHYDLGMPDDEAEGEEAQHGDGWPQ